MKKIIILVIILVNIIMVGNCLEDVTDYLENDEMRSCYLMTIELKNILNNPEELVDPKSKFNRFDQSTKIVKDRKGNILGGENFLVNNSIDALICSNSKNIIDFLKKLGYDEIEYYKLIITPYFRNIKDIEGGLLFFESKNNYYIIPMLGKYSNYRGFENHKVYTLYQFNKLSQKEYNFEMFGKNVECNENPQGFLDLVMIPVRAYFEHLNCKVEWLENERAILITSDKDEFKLIINKQNTAELLFNEEKIAIYSENMIVDNIEEINCILKNGSALIPYYIDFIPWFEKIYRNQEITTVCDFDNFIITTNYTTREAIQ